MCNKTYTITIFLFICTCIPLQAQMKWNQAYQQYFDQYKDLAIEEMLHYHIPASITLAQGVFESRAGMSKLAMQGNNHFGIKCHGWKGRSMMQDDDEAGECFRVYNNVKESYEDHSVFLRNNRRYAQLFRLKLTDYRGWAHGLKACGYATNPHYSQKLIDIIELYKLYNYDKAKKYDKFMAQHGGEDQPNSYGARLHPIHTFNKNYYLVARNGDTFKSIAQETGLSWRKLAKYNELDKNAILHQGDIVYLKKKQKKAPKAYKHRLHTVQSGESMYSISQLYGIRLKYLYKKNRLSPDYQIRPGDTLRVY